MAEACQQRFKRKSGQEFMNQDCLKKEIVSIFMIGKDTLNRLMRKYKEAGNIEPCRRTKYRAGKFSDEALCEHVLTNQSAALEEIALFFSVKRQSVFTRIKFLGTTRQKRSFSMKKEMRRKEMNSAK